MHYSNLVGIFLFPIALQAHAQGILLDYFELPIQVDVGKLGYGFDLFSGQVKSGTCLTNAKVLKNEVSQPGGRLTEFTLVSDSSQVSRAMNAQASASYSAPLGGGSASASASFANAFALETDSTWVVAKKLVPFATHTVVAKQRGNDAASLESSAFDVSKQLVPSTGSRASAQLLTFRQRCGDGYISAITYGGLLLGRMRFSNRSQLEKSRTDVQFSAAGLGLNVAGQLNQSLMTAMKSKDVTLDAVEIGSGTKRSPTNIDQFVEYFASYGLDFNFSPRPISITVASYTTLPSWPRHEQLDLRTVPSAMHTASLNRSRLIDLEKKYSLARQNSGQRYNIFYKDWPAFDNEHERILQTIRALNALINACASNSNACRFEQPAVSSTSVQTGRKIDDILSLVSRDTFAYTSAARLSPESTKPTLAATVQRFDFDRLAKDYYVWLLSLPLQRHPDKAQDELLDMFSVNNLDNVKQSIVAKSLAESDIARIRADIVNWLLNRRFDPLRSSYCSTDAANSSMCSVPRATVYSDLAVFLYDKGIDAPPLPPDPVPEPRRGGTCYYYEKGGRCEQIR